MKTEPALSLGPQPTPEMEAIAREIDALARERLALDAELAAKQRELSVKAGEADSLQSELDTLTATLKQLENQKGEAQKRLNDLKAQVDKLRSQVSAQEAAAAETEAEVAARRAAAQTLKEKERDLQQECAAAEAECDSITAQLRKAVLALSQANIKIAHLEEQHRLIENAIEALSLGGAAAAAAASLQPQYSREHLDKLVRGATPSDALEDDSFSAGGFGAMNGGGAAFGADPFGGAAFPAAADDPFAPNARSAAAAQDGFGSDPFAPSGGADPFAGDAFAPTDNKNKANDDGTWEADPFAVLHAPTRASPPTPRLPPKQPPPRPAPPRPTPPNKARAASAMDFTEDPFKDYRYEDPFNIEDPFADATDSKRSFASDAFFTPTVNGRAPSGRVSAPPVASDPFFAPPKPNNSSNDSWAAFPEDNWAADDSWAKPSAPLDDAWTTNTPKDSKMDNWSKKTDNFARKTDNWADFPTDHNKNLNETWPSTLPTKKEKSPKPVKYAKSLVHTIGGIGRTRQSKKKGLEAKSVDSLPSEEQQWAWAAAESRRLQAEADARRRREDADLQLALALSKRDQ